MRNLSQRHLPAVKMRIAPAAVEMGGPGGMNEAQGKQMTGSVDGLLTRPRHLPMPTSAREPWWRAANCPSRRQTHHRKYDVADTPNPLLLPPIDIYLCHCGMCCFIAPECKLPHRVRAASSPRQNTVVFVLCICGGLCRGVNGSRL